MTIKPRQLTNDELAAALEQGNAGTTFEAAARLRGESTAGRQESIPRIRFITDDEQKILDTLELYELDNPDVLDVGLRVLDDAYSHQLTRFLDSDGWQSWDSDNRNNMMIDDPERYARCQEAAEHGTDGSTHREIIEDWKDAIENVESNPILRMILAREIYRVWRWHEQNGSIDDQLS